MRVLVIDDEVRMATALRRGLRAEGFAVDLATDGPSGLRLAAERTYDVIVLDVLLPGLNGHQVCRQLRLVGNSTPVLMVTAKTGDGDQAEAFEAGADDFLRKPFPYTMFVERLRALEHPAAGYSPAHAEVDSVTR
jgi:DNA-binding response OmpR family regulator